MLSEDTKTLSFRIVGAKYNEWSNTTWSGQIAPVTIDRCLLSEYKDRYAVNVFGKLLGLLPVEKENLFFGSRFYASFFSYDSYVEGTIVDLPAELIEIDSRKICPDEALTPYVWELLFEESEYIDGFCDTKLEEVYTYPDVFIEWLIRTEQYQLNSFVEINDSLVENFRSFHSWLQREHKSLDNYSDRDIREYQHEKVGFDCGYDSYEIDQQKFVEQYGKGSYKDSYGCVFDSDGKWIDF